MQLALLKLVKKVLGTDFLKINLQYLLRKEDLDKETRQSPYFDRSLRDIIFNTAAKGAKQPWSGVIGAHFDIIQSQNRKVIRYLIKNGISFTIVEGVQGLSPLLWACCLRDLETIKILVEDAKVGLTQQQHDKALSILRKPAATSTNDSWIYSTEIENYLKEHKILNGKNVASPFDYIK